MNPLLSQTSIWHTLRQHQQATQSLHMRDLFAQDHQRFQSMHESLDGLLVDYSKNRITETTLQLLIELAQASQLSDWMNQLRFGEVVNLSEHRSSLHTILRLPESEWAAFSTNQTITTAHAELNRALSLAERVFSGEAKGSSGAVITDVVNIGVGGSDLGSQVITSALTAYHGRARVHFVSNIDEEYLHQILNQIDARSSIFIIASKSFLTPETLINAVTIRQWFLQQGLSEADMAQHFFAVSNNVQAACEWGIQENHIFCMTDDVGGRYSVWSVMGLAAMCAIGREHFRSFLRGAHAMDVHFFETPFRHNIPVLLGLIGVWYHTFYQAASHAMIPYAYNLRKLPDYLQQLEMESLGKRVDRLGNALDFDTGAVIWGEIGVNGQHTCFQLLHQGSRLVPCDFIVPINTHNAQSRVSVANALAQTEALMKGKTLAESLEELSHLDSMNRSQLAPQRVLPGNRPSNMIFLEALTPFYLGMLLAMYEHKVFVQANIWGINPFDQWGVEFGKALAMAIQPQLTDDSALTHDSSTNGLITYLRRYYERTR